MWLFGAANIKNTAVRNNVSFLMYPRCLTVHVHAIFTDIQV